MKFFRVENFLCERQNQFLLDWCLGNSRTFVPSIVTTGDGSYRKSLVTYSCSLADLVSEKVKTILPVVSSALEVPINSEFWFESHVTAHGNGDYFKVHVDKDNYHCLHRALSYVYYFHNQPKSFEGGELALYSDREKRSRILIEPKNNTLVCFPATAWHEVLPVMGGTAFDESRFTVNGWINQL